MKKGRMFFVAAVLTLITAGLMAFKKPLSGPGLYIDKAGVKIQIDDATSWPGLTTSPSGTQARLCGNAGACYSLYSSVDGSTFNAVYASGW